MFNQIHDLLDKLQIKPNDLLLYERAFTHSSYNVDANTSHQDYERLEFVGDSVINFVVADLAFNIHKEMTQGDLSKLRAAIVQSKALADKALKFNLDSYIRLGHSLPENTRSSKRILEDVFEAFIGAIYIDQGLNFTYKFVKNIFLDDITYFDMKQFKDYKSELQEEMQAEHREAVKYIVIEEHGPAHDKTFVVKVTYNDVTLGIGQGKTKKDAEQNAACDALRKKAS